MPSRIRALPRDRHGRPVPWFVATIDGLPDHRVAREEALVQAVRDRKCWTCGQRMAATVTFVVGPICVVNRITAEPPSHRDCAGYAVVACPFLTRPQMRRREPDGPEGTVQPVGMVRHNPGVAVLWQTRSFMVESVVRRKVLLRIGTPTRVEWWAQGRVATPEEALTAFTSGVEVLQSAAATEGPRAAVRLEQAIEAATTLVPVR